MPRGNPEPWLRQGRGYFVTLDGVQHNLRTADKAEAYKRWHLLMAQRGHAPRRLDDDPFVVDLLALFCDWAEHQLAPASYVWYRNYLRDLVKRLDQSLKASRFKPYDVTKWLDDNPQWGASGRRGAITAVKRAFSWAEQQGLIDRSPVAHLRRPAAARRTTTLTADQRRLIFESASDQAFRDLLFAAELTGVRPQEIRRVEARHFDEGKGTWLFSVEENKTGDKTGRPRVVFLPPPVVDLCRRLAQEHPAGPLFRNSRARPWTADTIRLRFKRLRKRLAGQLPSDLCMYLYRHTFATDALENGLNPVTVAELLGHADASTLSRVYQHLADRHDHMRDAAARATAGSASRPAAAS
jgi:integrase